MEFSVLGPVQAIVDGRPLRLGRRRERLILGLLLLDPGRAVTFDRLADLIWSEQQPADVRGALHTYASRLRTSLMPWGVSIVSRGEGYLIETDPDAVDAHRFRTQLAQARAETDPARRARALEAALALWRGPVLADVADDRLRERVARDLTELHPAALELLAEAELDSGRPDQAIACLTVPITEHRLREHMAWLLMLALHRCGQSAEALDTYRATRQVLVNELGLEPGDALRELQGRILRDDLGLRPDTVLPIGSSIAAGTNPRCMSLPRDVPGFTARAAAIAELDGVLDDAGAAAPIVVITGTAGVGKTALAVHWGHRVAGRFPDGLLYVNLRGYDRARPLNGAEVIATLLIDFGVMPDRIPTNAEAAAALYRSVLAGRRVLIVLDNAGSADQVRTALTASRGCLTLVTSRDRLSGLVVRDSARRLTLGVLSPDESAELIAGIVGAARAHAEPSATAELSIACGHLPLALRIAAAGIADRPGRTIKTHVNELLASDRLAALDVHGDPGSSVQAAFLQSYATLAAPTRRLFRLLSVVPGADVTAAAAATLLDADQPHAGQLLDRLAAAHLVEERAPGRYGWHDLMRAFAEERGHDEDSTADRAAALDRLYAWYLRTTDAAAQQLYPTFLRLPLAADDSTSVSFEDSAAARAWLDAERDNVLSAFRRPIEPHPTLRLLAAALRGYLWLRGDYRDWVDVATSGLAAAERCGDRLAQAAAELSLGQADLQIGEYKQSAQHFGRALELSRQTHWPECEASALTLRTDAHVELGELKRAAVQARMALRINQRLGRRPGQAVNLHALGDIHLRWGRLNEAVDLIAEALEIQRLSHAPSSVANVLLCLSRARCQLGDLDEASARAGEALTLYQRTGSRRGESTARAVLASILADRGDFDAALPYIEEALCGLDRANDSVLWGGLHTIAGTIHRGLRDYPLAITTHNVALAQARSRRDQLSTAIALTGLAEAEQALDPGRAIRYALRAIAIARKHGYRVVEGNALNAITAAHVASADRNAALTHADLALAIHQQTGHRLGEARTLDLLGQIHAGALARSYSNAAVTLYTKIGAVCRGTW